MQASKFVTVLMINSSIAFSRCHFNRRNTIKATVLHITPIKEKMQINTFPNMYSTGIVFDAESLNFDGQLNSICLQVKFSNESVGFRVVKDEFNIINFETQK